jgi:hypothetical protein
MVETAKYSVAPKFRDAADLNPPMTVHPYIPASLP